MKYSCGRACGSLDPLCEKGQISVAVSMMDRVHPLAVMSLTLQPAPIVPEAPVALQPRYIVGQDPEGHWVAVETRGLAGGIFRSCKDAIHYAVGETQHRPDAVMLSADRIEFRM